MFQPPFWRFGWRFGCRSGGSTGRRSFASSSPWASRTRILDWDFPLTKPRALGDPPYLMIYAFIIGMFFLGIYYILTLGIYIYIYMYNIICIIMGIDLIYIGDILYNDT